MNLLICFSLLTQLSQAINNSSVPTAVGKCKISIEKNKEKQVVGFWLSVFGYELLIGATILPTTKYQQPNTNNLLP